MNALALGSWSNSVNPNASLMGGFGMMAMNGNSLGLPSQGMEMLAASFAMEGMGSGEFAMAMMEAGPGGLQCGLFLEALSEQSGECCPSTPAAATDEDMGTCGCSSSSSASASASASVSSSSPAPAPVQTEASHGGGGGDGNGGSSSCGGAGDAGSAGGGNGSSGCGGDGGSCGGSCSGGE